MSKLIWGAPAALWLGLSLLPIVLLYFLRLRYRRQPVSSIYLWSRLQRTIRGGSHLRRLPIFLLLLQLAAAAGAVLSAAQPAWFQRWLAEPGTVYLLDVSASMSAAEEGGSRLDEARRLLIAELTGARENNGPNMVFLCADGADPLGAPTNDRARLTAELKGITPRMTGFNETEVAEKLRAWLAGQERPWRVCLITDGGLDLGGRRLASVCRGGLRVLTVGADAGNIGVAGLRTAAGGVVFQVISSWPAERKVRVMLLRDSLVLARKTVTAAPGVGSHEIVLPDADTPGAYEIRLEQPADALAADDRTYLAVNALVPVRVLLAGPANPFLQAALRVRGVDLHETASLPPVWTAEKHWDLVVADRVALPQGIDADVLSFGFAPPDGPVDLGAAVTGTMVPSGIVHPLTRFVDWREARVIKGVGLVQGVGVQSLATVNGETILAAWEKDGRRRVVWGTSLLDSEIGLASGFPIFIQNCLRWCVPQFNNVLAYTATAGRPISLAAGSNWRILERNAAVVTKSGRVVTIHPLSTGFMHWREGERTGLLAAVLPPSESEIKPRILLADQAPVQAAAQYTSWRRPIWRWVLGLALACLCVEWLLWREGWPRLGRR